MVTAVTAELVAVLGLVFVALMAVTFREIHSHRGEHDRRVTVHLNGRPPR